MLFTKTTNSLFESPFGKVRGNVRTLSIDRWKARGRLPIRYNWTFLASSYGWDVISRYLSKSAFFKGRWDNLSTIFRWKGTSPTNLVWYQKTTLITLSCGVKISTVSSFVSSQSTRVTDRQIDGRKDRITIPKTALAYILHSAVNTIKSISLQRNFANVCAD